MQECCIFLNGFFPLPTLTPPGPNFGWRRGGFYIRPGSFTVTQDSCGVCSPLTTYPKSAIKNRNFASSHRRVLAPGRGQCVRSWILKGALAKRSCEARTQAPLSRAAVRSRSDQSPSGALKHTSGPALRDGGARCAPPSGRLGSSGTFLLLFWSQKSRNK